MILLFTFELGSIFYYDNEKQELHVEIYSHYVINFVALYIIIN